MPRFEVFAPTRANLRELNARAAAEKRRSPALTSPTIDSRYFAVLKSNPLRYHAALDFIRSLADCKPHPLAHSDTLFHDVRALMFFRFGDVRWRIGTDDAEVYSNRIHPGNPRKFFEALAREDAIA